MVILPSGYSNKFSMHISLPNSCYMPCPSHPLSFDRHNILAEDHKLLSPSLRNIVHFAVTSSLLGPIFSSESCFETFSVYFYHLR
jgi:hypothetical protein